MIVTSEIISIKCNEEDPLKRLDIKIKILSGNLNPFPLGVEPFSKQGAMIAEQFNNFKRECIDKW